MNDEFELEDLDLKSTPPPPSRSNNAPQTLETLDLAQELYTQFVDTKEFLRQLLLSETEYPPNQVIAVANSMRQLLTDITRLRTDLYNAERLKALEAATIQCMKNAPAAVQEEFFREYKRSIEMLKDKK